MHDASEQSMGIAELAHRAGVTPRTVRYYVAEGLLPPPGGQGQRRAYGPHHLERLEAIRALKAAYLPLHEIRRRLDDSSGSPPPCAGAETSARASGTVSQGSSPPIAVAAVTSQPPVGFGGGQGVGRIEIYDPPETAWRRHTLAPGVELHYRETDNPRLARAIQRLIREAAAILDDRPGRDAPKGR